MRLRIGLQINTGNIRLWAIAPWIPDAVFFATIDAGHLNHTSVIIHEFFQA